MIAVNGVEGFVGRNLVDKLVEKHDVRVYGREDTFFGEDIVFHLACDGDSRGSNRRLIEHTDNNLGIFTRVLDQSIKDGVKRFIYVSSSEAETEHNVYAVEKATCEKLLKIMAKEYRFDYVIVRPSNLFGEHMKFEDRQRGVIANFIRCKVTGEPFTIIDPTVTKKFTYVGDLVKVLEEAITDHTNETVTVTSGIETSIGDLAYMVDHLYETMLNVKLKHE